MSYIMEGSIVIEPPLNFFEIKIARETALKMLRPKSYAAQHATPYGVFSEYMPLTLHIEEFERVTDEGVLTVRQAKTLLPSWSSNAKLNYDIAQLVIALIKALPGHTWVGTVMAIHEERTNALKVVVEARGSGAPVEETVRKISGTVNIQWADGTSDRVDNLI